MTISIIIPIYNVEPYIERCIQSVLRQTYRDLEVILVDDCTPDRSMELAKACIEQSPLSKDLKFVFLQHEQNRGVSVCRNDGIDAATGEYLMFIDSDDYITDDCVETLAKPLKAYPYDMVVGGYELHENGLQYDDLSKLGIQGEVIGSKNIAACLLADKLYCMPWNKLYKSHYIKENKLYFQERLPIEDELWTPLVACTAKSLYAIQKKTYHYELREGSLMTSKEREPYFQTLLRILQCFYNHAEQRCPVLNADAAMMVEKRWIRYIYKYPPRSIPIFKIYPLIRQCDTRSLKTKLRTHRSIKNMALHIDQYLPVWVGYTCQKAIYGMKLAKHKLFMLYHQADHVS